MKQAKPCQSCGGEGCCEPAAIKLGRSTHTLEHLIAPFQSIHLFTMAVIVPNIYLVNMTEVPLDKVRAAGLVIRSHGKSVFRDGRASPWPLHLLEGIIICFQRRLAVESRCIFIIAASKRENGRENTIYSPLHSSPFFWLLICCKRVQILCLCKCHDSSFDKESLSFCLHLQKQAILLLLFSV